MLFAFLKELYREITIGPLLVLTLGERAGILVFKKKKKERKRWHKACEKPGRALLLAAVCGLLALLRSQLWYFRLDSDIIKQGFLPEPQTQTQHSALI